MKDSRQVTQQGNFFLQKWFMKIDGAENCAYDMYVSATMMKIFGVRW